MKAKTCFCAAVAAAVVSLAASAVEPNPSAKFIQRTMHKLAASTFEKPTDVKILFYGQSSVEGEWYKIIVNDLRRRFPTARIDARNTAIGGYEAQTLVTCLGSDVDSFYPDLIFLQDWGNYKALTALLRAIRARTTAEIVLWTSHVRAKQSLEEGLKESDDFSQLQCRLAAENDCMMIHLMRKWAKYHVDRGYPLTKFLAPDGVHMTAKAYEMYAGFITEELVLLDGAATTPQAGTVRHIPFWGHVKKQTNGVVEVTFTGNRVEAVAWPTVPTYRYHASPVKVLLDGREMSQMKELYATTRPSGLFNWMPAVNRVGFNTLPVEEEWTLTFIDGTDRGGQPVRYRVDGTVTGFDGEGSSAKDFVSKSGRVTIAADDFNTWLFKYYYGERKMEDRAALPGQWTFWRTERRFTDRLTTFLGPRERVLLVSGCANGTHRMTFVPAVPSKSIPLEELVVYAPAGASEAPARGEATNVRAVSADYVPGEAKLKK